MIVPHRCRPKAVGELSYVDLVFPVGGGGANVMVVHNVVIDAGD